MLPRCRQETPSLRIICRHTTAEAREAVEAVGARLLFLPPYSPDFNPIETIFAKMKAWIRRGAPRPTDALQDAACSAIDDVCHRLTVACFAAAGYEPDRSDYAMDLHDTAICLRGFLARRHFEARREVCSTWQRLA
ncbi:transposase [Asaia krungthepensis]|uniref:transposase n=1 Tax=Asaia krungthepensis TaxID=220990 RepID=UPI003570D395